MQFLSPFPISGVFSSPEARPEILASLGNRPWKSNIVIEGLAEMRRQTTDSDYGKKDDYILRFLDEDEVARPLQNARAALNTHHTTLSP
jgi:hypothetical protein